MCNSVSSMAITFNSITNSNCNDKVTVRNTLGNRASRLVSEPPAGAGTRGRAWTGEDCQPLLPWAPVAGKDWHDGQGRRGNQDLSVFQHLDLSTAGRPASPFLSAVVIKLSGPPLMFSLDPRSGPHSPNTGVLGLSKTDQHTQRGGYG